MAVAKPAPAKTKSEPKDLMAFSFSDTIAGYVKAYDRNADRFTLETTDGRVFSVGITPTTNAQLVHNLGEPYADATGQMRDMLVPGRFLVTYGVFYPEAGGHVYDALTITFPGARSRARRYPLASIPRKPSVPTPFANPERDCSISPRYQST